MKQIFVACPTPRDIKELPRLPDFSEYSFIHQDFITDDLEKLIYEDNIEQAVALDIAAMVDAIVEKYSDGSLAGIMSSDDYPGINIASAVAKRLGLSGPSPEKVLLCQHKYYARRAQQKHVPEAVPRFGIIGMDDADFTSPPLTYPFFLKPVKSVFSCFAQTISSDSELRHVLQHKLPHRDFFVPFNQLVEQYCSFEHDAYYMLAEEMLTGLQLTIEGYSFQGEIDFFGIVDSIMFPGTLSFKRFEYPSKLPEEVQNRIKYIARRCMKGIGFDNGLFNIEFFYNPDSNALHIIEINPRMASQFADLYEKVDGTNSYEALVAIAVNKRPVLKKREGRYKVAGSFVLREFENKLVKKVPNAEQISQVHEQFEDLRLEIFAEEGKHLSFTLQDGKSYRYGLIHLGGNSQDELEGNVQACTKMLDIQFEL
jgi:predicted ATP-grasp superfamily ATP-dependent carboligase